MNSIEDEMEKDGIPSHYDGFESLYSTYSKEEKEILQNRGYTTPWWEDPEYKKKYEDEDEDWDEGAFYDIVRGAVTESTDKVTKKLYIPKWHTWTIKIINRVVYITSKAFDMLRQIATDECVYRGAECAAFLYGKNQRISKVKQYVAHGSAGLITGNAIDMMKEIQKKNFIGIFHSHLFNSSSPSGTDRNSLNSWCVYTREIVGRKIMPVSLIGAFPLFKQSAYSMDDGLNMVQIKLIVV